MAVAAVNYALWLTGPQESFSSQGPTTDGRMKPEISGPDGNSSFIYPPPEGFLGTSAASPHVAGAAALILSNNPTFTVSQLWNFLTSTAIDMGSPGWDPIFGYGRVNLSTIFVDPDSIDFGEVIVGQFVEKTVTVRNVGNPNLVIGVITAPSAPFSLVADSCSGKSLPLAGSCTFKVRFSPLSAGNFNGALTIPSNDPFNSALPVSLKGEGVLIISLSSPTDQLSVGPCSVNVPPVFEWKVTVSFPNYELQFSADPGFSLDSCQDQGPWDTGLRHEPYSMEKGPVDSRSGGWNGLLEGHWNIIERSPERQWQAIHLDSRASTRGRPCDFAGQPQPFSDAYLAKRVQSQVQGMVRERSQFLCEEICLLQYSRSGSEWGRFFERTEFVPVAGNSNAGA